MTIRIIVTALALLLAAFIQFCFYFFKRTFVRAKTPAREHEHEVESFEMLIPEHQEKHREGEIWLDTTPHESVVIKSYDSLSLCGKLYPYPGSKKTILLFHGYRSSARLEFAPIAPFFHERGMNVLMVDQRAHASSEGRYICYGAKERYDCLEWVEFVRRRFGADCDIYLGGVSMGATTVLLAAGLNLPKNVKGIVADCGFSSPQGIIDSASRKSVLFRPFRWLFLPTLTSLCRRLAGFDPAGVSTVGAMKNNKIPVLFVHGENDDLIPLSMTEAAYNACSAPKELFVAPKAGHSLSYLTDTEQCQEMVKRFLGI